MTECAPLLADAEWALDQVCEYYKPLEELRKRLLIINAPPDDAARVDLLAEIARGSGSAEGEARKLDYRHRRR